MEERNEAAPKTRKVKKENEGNAIGSTYKKGEDRKGLRIVNGSPSY